MDDFQGPINPSVKREHEEWEDEISEETRGDEAVAPNHNDADRSSSEDSEGSLDDYSVTGSHSNQNSPQPGMAKRDHHNELERKRRDSLRNIFNRVTKLLPTTRDTKASRELVLTEMEKCTYYEKQLIKEFRRFRKADEKLTIMTEEYGKKAHEISKKKFPREMHFAALWDLNAEFGIVGMTGPDYFRKEEAKLLAWEKKLFSSKYTPEVSRTLQMSPIKQSDYENYRVEGEKSDDDDDEDWDDWVEDDDDSKWDNYDFDNPSSTDEEDDAEEDNSGEHTPPPSGA